MPDGAIGRKESRRGATWCDGLDPDEEDGEEEEGGGDGDGEEVGLGGQPPQLPVRPQQHEAHPFSCLLLFPGGGRK